MFNHLQKRLRLSRKAILAGLLAVFVLALVVLPTVVLAQDVQEPQEPSTVERLASRFVGWLGSKILALIGFIFTMLTRLLMWIVSYNGFVNSQPVVTGWTLVRDVSNLFFVLIILAIAIATILRIEKYNVKRLLPKVILMAVLVNFSLVIAGLILDFAQVVMLTFVAAFAGASGEGNLVVALGIDRIVTASINNTDPNFGLGALIVTLLLIIVMTLIATVVVAVMLAILTFRIVMIWVLLILSPLAYILAAFPQGERYSQQWWQEYTKYVIVGPVLAFFLWLTFAIATAVPEGSTILANNGQEHQPLPTLTGQTTDFGGGAIGGRIDTEAPTETVPLTQVAQPVNFANYVVAIAMLLGALVIAQQMGVAGSQFAGAAFSKIRATGMGAVRRAGRTAWGVTGRPAGWVAKTTAKAPFQFAGRKINEAIAENRLPPWINPRAMYRGWMGRREEQYHRAEDLSTKGAREVWEKIIEGTAMPYRAQAMQSEEGKIAQEYSSIMDKEEKAQKGIDLLQHGDSFEGRAQRRALIRSAAEEGQLDDLMGHPEMVEHVLDVARKKYASDEDFKKYADETGLLERMEGGEFYGYDQLHLFLEDYVGQTQEGLSTINYLEELARKTKHPEYAGHSTFRSKAEGGNDAMEMESLWSTQYKDAEGNMHTRKSGIARAIVEFNKWGGREKMGISPHSLTINKKEGTTGLDHFGAQIVTAALAAQDKRISEHTQNRLLKMLLGGTGEEMRWVEGQEGETAILANDPELAQRKAQALVLAMESAGKGAFGAAWQKVGGLGEEGKFRLGKEGGGYEEFTYDQLKQRYAVKDTMLEYESYDKTSARSGATGPAAPTPRPRLAQDAAFAATQEMVAKYGDEFFDSSMFDAGKHMSAQDFTARQQQQLATQAIQGVRTASRAAPERVEQTIAEINKSRLAKGQASLSDEEIEKMRHPQQVGLRLDLVSNPELREAIGFAANQEGGQYDATNGKDRVADILAEKLKGVAGVTEQELGQLVASIKNAKTLRIGQVGLANSDVERHERAETNVSRLNDQQIDSVWATVGKQQRQQILAQMRQWYPNLDERGQRREAIVEMVGVGKGPFKAQGTTLKTLQDVGINPRAGVGALTSGVKRIGLTGVLAAKIGRGISQGVAPIGRAIGKGIEKGMELGGKAAGRAGKIIEGIAAQELESGVGKARTAAERAAQKTAQKKERYERGQRYTGYLEQETRTQIGQYQKQYNELQQIAKAGGGEYQGQRLTDLQARKQANTVVRQIKAMERWVRIAQRQQQKAKKKYQKALGKSLTAKERLGGLQADQSGAESTALPPASAGRLARATEPPRQPSSQVVVPRQEIIEIGTQDLESQIAQFAQGVSGEKIAEALDSLEGSLGALKDTIGQLGASDNKDVALAGIRSELSNLRNVRGNVSAGGTLDSAALAGNLGRIAHDIRDLLAVERKEEEDIRQQS